MNKTIFLTGISGSGKSTIAKQFSKLGYEYISLDEITKYYQKGRSIKNEKIKRFMNYISNNNYNTSWNKDDYLIINSFIKYITQLDGKYIIEGIHLFMPYIDRDYIINYDIYIIDISSIKALIRRIKRGYFKDVHWVIKIYNIIKYDLNPSFIIDDIKFRKFKREMKKRNKKLVVL